MVNTPLVIIIIGLCILGLLSLVGGVICLVKYARTRKVTWLVAGLLLTFLVPGLACLCALAVFYPSIMVVYGPPPEMMP
ncbi:MAG: hypothetical protein ABIJ39_11345 [Chloroflexota bacterium]